MLGHGALDAANPYGAGPAKNEVNALRIAILHARPVHDRNAYIIGYKMLKVPVCSSKAEPHVLVQLLSNYESIPRNWGGYYPRRKSVSRRLSGNYTCIL
jgi:hypothetical protein